jgi:hypothetical protein
MGKTEIRNINAPEIPSRGISPRISLVLLLIRRMPMTTNMAAIAYHIAHQLAGKIPSAMCIAYAGVGFKNSPRTSTSANAI